MNKLALAATGALSVALAAAPALAATTSGGSASIVSVTDYNTRFSSNLSLFNGQVGTITGIQFTIAYGFDSVVTVSASNTSMGTVETRSAAAFTSSDAAIQQVFRNTFPRVGFALGSRMLDDAAFDLSGARSSYNVRAGESVTYNSNARTETRTFSVAQGDFAAFYAGAGRSSFDVSGRTLTGLIVSAAGGNAAASQRTVAQQDIGIVYSYNSTPFVAPSVPEPATWGLMLAGFGMVGAGMRSRRRRVTFANA